MRTRGCKFLSVGRSISSPLFRRLLTDTEVDAGRLFGFPLSPPSLSLSHFIFLFLVFPPVSHYSLSLSHSPSLFHPPAVAARPRLTGLLDWVVSNPLCHSGSRLLTAITGISSRPLEIEVKVIRCFLRCSSISFIEFKVTTAYPLSLSFFSLLSRSVLPEFPLNRISVFINVLLPLSLFLLFPLPLL